MKYFLPLIFLSLITYHLSLVSPSFAQETARVGSGSDDFFDTLFSSRLENINKASLPFEAGEDIGSVSESRENEQTKQTVEYSIAAAISLPWETSRVSLSWTDILASIMDKGKLMLGLGNQKARDWAASYIPSIDTIASGVQRQKVSVDSNSEKVLGSSDDESDESQTQAIMTEISLPLVECAHLPYIFCEDRLYK